MPDRSPKVLLPHRLLGNIYVREVGRAYQELGCEVVFGPENLFESNYAPDIAHLNWPEELYRGFGDGPVEERARVLVQRLHALKERRVCVAWTVHNETPHENLDGGLDKDVYQQLIDHVDVVHHHSEYSRTSMASKYRMPLNATQFVAHHGHYLSYKNTTSQADARKRLGIDPNAFVYLHFGAIRGYKGLSNVLRAFSKMKGNNDILMIVGRLSGRQDLGERIRLAGYRYLSRSHKLNLHSVNSDDIQLYVNASDAMVLGHSRGLTSGVAVLGMTFGKPVIGPDLGGIKATLRQGRNLIYETGNVDDFASKMVAAKNLNLDDVRTENQTVAESWSWTAIAQPVIDRYRQTGH